MRCERIEYRLNVVQGRPRSDRAVGDAQVIVLHHQLGVEIHYRADSRALGAGAVWTVEREHPRRDLGIRNSAIHAREALAEVDSRVVLRIHALDLEQVLPVLERHFQRVGKALFDSAANREPVDYHLDRVALVLVERDLLAQLANRAVDLDPHEAGAPQLAHLLPIFALAIADDRREHVDSRPLGPTHDPIDDLLDALLRDLTAAVVAMGAADAREQQAQVVVDLGNRADRGTRVVRGALLLD